MADSTPAGPADRSTSASGLAAGTTSAAPIVVTGRPAASWTSLPTGMLGLWASGVSGTEVLPAMSCWLVALPRATICCSTPATEPALPDSSNRSASSRLAGGAMASTCVRTSALKASASKRPGSLTPMSSIRTVAACWPTSRTGSGSEAAWALAAAGLPRVCAVVVATRASARSSRASSAGAAEGPAVVGAAGAVGGVVDPVVVGDDGLPAGGPRPSAVVPPFSRGVRCGAASGVATPPCPPARPRSIGITVARVSSAPGWTRASRSSRTGAAARRWPRSTTSAARCGGRSGGRSGWRRLVESWSRVVGARSSCAAGPVGGSPASAVRVRSRVEEAAATRRAAARRGGSLVEAGARARAGAGAARTDGRTAAAPRAGLTSRCYGSPALGDHSQVGLQPVELGRDPSPNMKASGSTASAAAVGGNTSPGYDTGLSNHLTGRSAAVSMKA